MLRPPSHAVWSCAVGWSMHRHWFSFGCLLDLGHFKTCFRATTLPCWRCIVISRPEEEAVMVHGVGPSPLVRGGLYTTLLSTMGTFEWFTAEVASAAKKLVQGRESRVTIATRGGATGQRMRGSAHNPSVCCHWCGQCMQLIKTLPCKHRGNTGYTSLAMDMKGEKNGYTNDNSY